MIYLLGNLMRLLKFLVYFLVKCVDNVVNWKLSTDAKRTSFCLRNVVI